MSSKTHLRRLALAATFTVVLFSVAGARAEQYRVLASSVPDIKVGLTISHDTRVKLPSGAELRLQNLPRATTHRILGPYEGTIASYQPCGGLKRLFGLCPTVEDEPIGGTRGPRVRTIAGPDDSAGAVKK